jgi:hypothetical protein
MEKREIFKSINVHILLKLVEHRYWQHKHTNINNLPKGLPSYLRDSKYVKTVIKELINQEYFLSKPTNYGLELSLNVKKKKKIESFIEKKL